MEIEINTLAVKPIEKETIPNKIIREIKHLIDSGQLQPGSRLPPERDFAQMLNVSRPSLREALRALSFLGVVENRQGDGTFLADDSVKLPTDALGILLTIRRGTLIEVYEARIAFETYATKLAAERHTKEDLQLLKANLETAKKNLDDPEKFLEYDMEFHRLLAEISKNQIILKIVEKLHHMFFPIRVLLHRQFEKEHYRIDFNYQDHEMILKYIEARDGENALIYVKKHFEKYRDKILMA
jgi:GntR family transcriptional regulator, transcriptional repressor for pyruvate dehydrogenase complex